MYRSTDYGATWSEINAGLTNPIVFALAFNSNGAIYAGTDGGGMFCMMGNAERWTQINTGLMNTAILSLVLDSKGFIFAGTSGGGVFRSIRSTTSLN
jgi:isoaspartyl peptidase/L-asparaginase-like protein (Ntn-hydrolase superfamily)